MKCETIKNAIHAAFGSYFRITNYSKKRWEDFNLRLACSGEDMEDYVIIETVKEEGIFDLYKHITDLKIDKRSYSVVYIKYETKRTISVKIYKIYRYSGDFYFIIDYYRKALIYVFRDLWKVNDFNTVYVKYSGEVLKHPDLIRKYGDNNIYVKLIENDNEETKKAMDELYDKILNS